jgi:hypothetical protein
VKEIKEVDCYICDKVQSCNLDICLYEEEGLVIKNSYCDTCNKMIIENEKQYCNNQKKCNAVELERTYGHIVTIPDYFIDLTYG